MMAVWQKLAGKLWLGTYLVMMAVLSAKPTPAIGQGPEYVTLFADDFESGVNAAWTQRGFIEGEWGVAKEDSNHFLYLKGGLSIVVASSGTTWDDYFLRVRVALLGGEVGIMFRQQTGAPGSTTEPIDRYLLQLSLYDMRLYKSRAFRETGLKPQNVLLGTSKADLISGRWYSIHIGGSGNQLTVSLDGAVKLRLADTQEPLLYGSIGFSGSPGSEVSIDDVLVGRVRAPQAPPQPTPTPMIFPTPLPTSTPRAPALPAAPQAPAATPSSPHQEQTRGPLFGSLVSFEALTTIITALALLGGLAGWLITRRARESRKRRQQKLLNEIDLVYTQFKMNTRRCEAELYRLKDIIIEEVTQARISEPTYEILDKRIDSYLREIQERVIDEKLGGFPSRLRNSLTRMLEEGAIGEQEFDSIEKLLMATAELSDADKTELKDSLARWRSSYVRKDKADKGEQ